MQGMVSCKKKSPLLYLLRPTSAQNRETYKATSSWHSVWTMIAHMAGNGIQTQILGASLTWKPAMMFGA